MPDILLLLVSFVTSTIAAIAGLGGGMLLIAVLPGMLPAQAVIPVHGIAQLASNASRALFAIRHVNKAYLIPFLVGSIIGVVCMSVVIDYFSADALLGFVGIYILMTLWSEAFSRLLRKAETFYSAGFLQTGLSMVVGATGPLTTTLLTKRSDCKEEIVSTNAVFMALSHAFKIPVFLFLGFNFLAYWQLIFWLVVGAVVGSWAGTHLRQRIDNAVFKRWVKFALTLLAINLIISRLILEQF